MCYHLEIRTWGVDAIARGLWGGRGCVLCVRSCLVSRGALVEEAILGARQTDRLQFPASSTVSAVTQHHMTAFRPVGFEGKGSKLIPTWSPLSR